MEEEKLLHFILHASLLFFDQLMLFVLPLVDYGNARSRAYFAFSFLFLELFA